MQKKAFSFKFILSAAVIIVCGLICFFLVSNRNDCSTMELREKYLRRLDYFGNAGIGSEIMIDEYIISGYTASNGNYGVAIFKPVHGKKYKFQHNFNRGANEVLITSTFINGVHYNLFWANKADLDYAQITYSSSEGEQEYRLDASNNKILYLQAPYKDFEVSAEFVTKDGNIYR